MNHELTGRERRRSDAGGGPPRCPLPAGSHRRCRGQRQPWARCGADLVHAVPRSADGSGHVNKSLRAQVALAELEAMGLTVDDLVVAAGRDGSAPLPKRTVAEYLPVVAAGYKPRTRRTYNSYEAGRQRASNATSVPRIVGGDQRPYLRPDIHPRAGARALVTTDAPHRPRLTAHGHYGGRASGRVRGRPGLRRPSARIGHGHLHQGRHPRGRLGSREAHVARPVTTLRCSPMAGSDRWRRARRGWGVRRAA